MPSTQSSAFCSTPLNRHCIGGETVEVISVVANFSFYIPSEIRMESQVLMEDLERQTQTTTLLCRYFEAKNAVLPKWVSRYISMKLKK
uniref:PRELI/MSF1 domain-containing protein n=1 Tax=Angiostrongylus cantonensis TaxID=6313 RepID=A0A0K0D848_ANGCA